MRLTAAILLSLAGPSTAFAGEGQDRLELVVEPAYRAYELGEAVYVNCWLRNPHRLPLAVEARHVRVSMRHWKEPKRVYLRSTPRRTGKREFDWSSHTTIPLGMIDVGCSAGAREDLDEVTFTTPGKAVCDITVRVIVGRDEGVATSLTATCIVFLAERVSEYNPPLTVEQVRSPWLYRLQTARSVYPSKPEFDATLAFAVANSATGIGRNLLFRLAMAASRAVPLYSVPRTQVDRSLSFADVVTMSREERKALRLGGSFGPEGPRPDIVVKLLETLLRNDSGHYVMYDEAAITLAKHLCLMGDVNAAKYWCRKVIQRGTVERAWPSAARNLLAAIENGTWRTADLQREGPSKNARPRMTAQELEAVLEKSLRMSPLKVELPLGDWICLLEVKTGTKLPVAYEDPDIERIVIAGAGSDSETPATVGSYLCHLLSLYDLSYRVSEGALIISRIPRLPAQGPVPRMEARDPMIDSGIRALRAVRGRSPASDGETEGEN